MDHKRHRMQSDPDLLSMGVRQPSVLLTHSDDLLPRKLPRLFPLSGISMCVMTGKRERAIEAYPSYYLHLRKPHVVNVPFFLASYGSCLHAMRKHMVLRNSKLLKSNLDKCDS